MAVPTDQQILDKLREALYALTVSDTSDPLTPPVATITFGDGRTVTFRDPAKIQALIETYERRVERAAGGGIATVLGRLRP